MRDTIGNAGSCGYHEHGDAELGSLNTRAELMDPLCCPRIYRWVISKLAQDRHGVLQAFVRFKKTQPLKVAS